MAYVKDSRSAKVRKQLDHPVIDGDSSSGRIYSGRQ